MNARQLIGALAIGATGACSSSNGPSEPIIVLQDASVDIIHEASTLNPYAEALSAHAAMQRRGIAFANEAIVQYASVGKSDPKQANASIASYMATHYGPLVSSPVDAGWKSMSLGADVPTNADDIPFEACTKVGGGGNGDLWPPPDPNDPNPWNSRAPDGYAWSYANPGCFEVFAVSCMVSNLEANSTTEVITYSKGHCLTSDCNSKCDLIRMPHPEIQVPETAFDGADDEECKCDLPDDGIEADWEHFPNAPILSAAGADQCARTKCAEFEYGCVYLLPEQWGCQLSGCGQSGAVKWCNGGGKKTCYVSECYYQCFNSKTGKIVGTKVELHSRYGAYAEVCTPFDPKFKWPWESDTPESPRPEPN